MGDGAIEDACEDDEAAERDGVAPPRQLPVERSGGGCGRDEEDEEDEVESLLMDDFLRRTEFRKKSSSQFSSMM